MIHISTSFALLVVAIIILVCIAGSRLSGRLGVPTLFIFIMLGMLFGSDGIFKIPFGNFALAEQVCSVALIFIMFYGGFGTRWSEAKPVAGPKRIDTGNLSFPGFQSLIVILENSTVYKTLTSSSLERR